MMTLLKYLLVLTGVICCTAAPASEPEAPPGSCGVPPRFQDRALQGNWDEESYKPGTFAQYTCRPGFTRLGSIRFECKDGQWLSVTPTGQCRKKSCGHPGDIEFGAFELKTEEEFVLGAVVEYTCNDGYQMISKHRTRECTASGWSNYRPECEVRYCPPVQVLSNVNFLTTSYEEEYSVGQVIRFECKNSDQKLKGVSEIFCTSEGDWNAPPPTCEEISCSSPVINHGSVSNTKLLYKDKDTTEFSCNSGYRPATTTVLTCTKNDWRPTPICEEIACYQDTVRNGKIKHTKETYREGDTVELKCNEGYQIEQKPTELRKCTAHGWSPPLKCISKKCSKPNVINGYLYYYYEFPLNTGRQVTFACNDEFRTQEKSYYGTAQCTTNGWEPEPRCFRTCNNPYSPNAKIQYTSYYYIEGDKVTIRCNSGFEIGGQRAVGQIECLPDGTFVGDKCEKTCQTPALKNGRYKQNINKVEVGTYLLYECNEGFVSQNNKVEDKSQCTQNGWDRIPACKEIECKIPNTQYRKAYKYDEVLHFKCINDLKLEGANSSQCFYYGWGPAFPVCKDADGYEYVPVLDSFFWSKEPSCPPANAPPNAYIQNPKDKYFDDDVIEIACNPGYLLQGSKTFQCSNGRWQSPPWCIERIKCSTAPPKINNGEIIKDTLQRQYFTGSTVRYTCSNGYHIIGSDENTCMDGKWLPSPTCKENSCESPEEIVNGKAQDKKTEYKHGERVVYECSPGYTFMDNGAAVCVLGKWQRVPKCIFSACGSPPKVKDGNVRGVIKDTYLTGEKVYYDCAEGFKMGQRTHYVTCENSEWTEPPECKRIGQACSAPPIVQHGDITEMKRQTYTTGSSVTYKCANFYVLDGKITISCINGEWEKEPMCRVPCTVKESDMRQNNIQLKHKLEQDKTKKIYSTHRDNMTFECIKGYEISNEKLLRIQCLDGVLKYPKCLKMGSCIIQETEMSQNNIHYNKSTEIEDGQTIEFECQRGMVKQNTLNAKCVNKVIKYPRCFSGRPCRTPKIANAIVFPENQDSHESGSSVDVKCKETYVLSGHTSVKCENGQWGELPKCLEPCTILDANLDKNNIELKSQNLPEMLEHGTEVNVKCKTNFKRPGALMASCSDGTMKYPRCFSGGTCRIIQQELDDNFLELDEGHDNEVFYEEGETVTFKCKAGYNSETGLNGICTKESPTKYTLSYPTCA